MFIELENENYKKKCQSIFDMLDKVTNKINNNLNYDPSNIIKNSNKKYTTYNIDENEKKSFVFSDNFFNFPKNIEGDIDDINFSENQNEIDNSEQIISNSRNEKNLEEKKLENEKIKQNLFRKINKPDNSNKKQKRNYDLNEYNQMELDIEENISNNEQNKYDNIKHFKNENLFTNELESKDNFMDICDYISKEIKDNNIKIPKHENYKNPKFENFEPDLDSNNSNKQENNNDNFYMQNTELKFKKVKPNKNRMKNIEKYE